MKGEKKLNKGDGLLISAFHPSLIFCTEDVQWDSQEFQDALIGNLLSHMDRMEELKIKIAWSDEFINYFWQNAPWRGDVYHENYLTEIIYHKMANSFETIKPPPYTECQINPDIQNDFSEEIRNAWLILIHRLLHNQKKTFVVIGLNTGIGIGSIEVFCTCEDEHRDDYTIVKKPSEWYAKIDYMKKCPDTLDCRDEDFRLAIKMCREQELTLREFKTMPGDIEFSTNFKNSFLDLQGNGKRKRIIKRITKLLTLNHKEAGCDGGLQEELIRGEYRIRISRGERVHYKEHEGKKTFLEYYTSSKHNTRL